MAVAGGARSSIEELLCAAGGTGEPEEVRTRTGGRGIYLLKNGVHKGRGRRAAAKSRNGIDNG